MRLFVLGASLLVLSASLASAHMEMVNPPPRDSKYIPAPLNAGLNIDYTNTAPLGGPRPYPCGHNKGPIVADLKAGSSFNVQIAGGAPHDGGHCQFAISYDNGVTFVVLKTVVRECLRGEGLSYSVPLPASAPNSNSAIFAWTWINAVGNREYYMNCADVSVSGGQSSGSITGPQLLVVNIPPSSVVIPEFPGQNTAAIDGRNYLDARPTITVTAGSTGPGIFTGQGAASVSAPRPAPAPAPASPPAASPPAASPPASSGACSEGDLQCQTSVSARSFRQCNQGSWVTQNCPLNTACVQSMSNMVECRLSGVTNQAAATSPSPSPSAPASSSPPASSSSTSGGACTVGAYECLVGAQFRQCDGSATWVNKSCMSGLVCRQYGTDIVCDWP